MGTETATCTRVVLHGTGGPEVLRLEEGPLPEPGPGEARIRLAACGVNFIDTYHRSGLYPVPLPSGLGREGAGVVEALGADTPGWSEGRRVVFCGGSLGSYATHHLVPIRHLVELPEGIEPEIAAASFLKGLTVQYLVREIHRVQAGETVLLHAAAGGVGLLAAQWLRALGARVIGTAGSPEKAELARAAGCDEVLLYREENVPARVRELTGGEGVPVVLDGVGASTFEASLDSLSRRGLLVSFGNASGPVRGVDLGILAAKGSLFVTRPTLDHFIPTRAALEHAAGELFEQVLAGRVVPSIGSQLPLAEAARAHRELESRLTTGSTILLP